MIKKIIYRLLSFFQIPLEAVKMFGTANDISGLNKENLPVELLPLNTTQFSRGLMNFTVFQTNLNWILPYWAEMQYNFRSLSFVPRSHLGMSMNVTQRNWTAVGNPDCDTEPIVDPRGLITPFKNGWSVDVWFKTKDGIIFPSKHDEVRQSLIEDLPLVETKIFSSGNEFSCTVYTTGGKLFINARRRSAVKCSVIFSVRPYNPEGISLIDNIKYDQLSGKFKINKKESIKFNTAPVKVYCSSYISGDAVMGLGKEEDSYSSECEYGLASAVAEFEFQETDSEVICICRLDGKEKPLKYSTEQDALDNWKSTLSKGISVHTPEDKLNSLFKFSLSSLLMFADRDYITPGPFTYHQFWIRDAAYMINILDKSGYHTTTGNILKKIRKYQDKKGYFRSQKGEWDSNGQVLWMMYQNARLSGSTEIVRDNFDSLKKGFYWIKKTRLKDKKYLGVPYYGLLPSGLSAEHLGLADFYFWDNFWSLAGVAAYTGICNLLDRCDEAGESLKLFEEYSEDINSSIADVQKNFLTEVIPASCTRGIDCGMIGSVCAAYPLQLFGDGDPNIIKTVDAVYTKFFFRGMFFQNIIHSGMNAYLTLQTGHSYLYHGNRIRFWEILSSVSNMASETLTYPEAIHPFTNGGVMGDGHHGWAAAEIVSAVRDAFVYEKLNYSSELKEYILLSGLPAEWFSGDVPFGIRNTSVFGGELSVSVSPGRDKIKIAVQTSLSAIENRIKFHFKIPVKAKKIISAGKEIPFYKGTETNFYLSSLSAEILLYLI